MTEMLVVSTGPRNFIVTVIIPFRDSMATLPRMIRSLSEALATVADEGVEILFIDNGSNDKSREIVDTFCATQKYARCIHEPSPGVSAARNAGLAAALGEYIASIDSDDEVAPEYISTLLPLLRQSPDMVLLPFVPKSRFMGPQIAKDRRDALAVLRGWWCCQFVYRRVLCAGLFFRGQCYEDFGFFPRILQVSERIAIFHGELYLYRENLNSLTRKSALWRLSQLEEVGLDLLADKTLTDHDIVLRIKRDFLRGRMQLRAIAGFWPVLPLRDCVSLVLLSKGDRYGRGWQILRLSASVLYRMALGSARNV